MFAFGPSDVVEAFRESTGLEPTLWKCDCGCQACIAYARDDRALWFVSSMSPDSQLHIVGFQTARELTDFLDEVGKRLNRKTMSMMRPTLEAAFERRKGKPS